MFCPLVLMHISDAATQPRMELFQSEVQEFLEFEVSPRSPAPEPTAADVAFAQTSVADPESAVGKLGVVAGALVVAPTDLEGFLTS